jgi:hypothetical protein
MENLSIYESCRAVPEEAKKKITGGRINGFTDINPMWRIKTLTELFGPCGIGWYYEVTSQYTEKVADEVAAFVNINLYIKVDGEWSKPIFGVGGSMLATKQRSGVFVSDECYKMATTDAISVACKQLGIGADVYWDKDSTKYSNQNSQAKPNQGNERLKEVFKELARVGYTEASLCKTYHLKQATDITDEQIAEFLKKIKVIPDKTEAQGGDS